jgi:hypothetical protein
MPSIRSDDEILKAFEGLQYPPGTTKPRREDNPTAKKRRKKILGESNGWDENPTVKLVKGVETELFSISALAQALEKQVVTIRLWEKKGFIPNAPYRLRSKSLNGKKVNGDRAYTRELIEIAIQEFNARGLLGSARVEWSQHSDLTLALLQRWRDAVQPRES